MSQLDEIKEWRARMVVSEEMAGRDRNQEFEEGRVAVYQHTLDDYDFMLGLIQAAEVAARETVMALDGVESTWDSAPASRPTYGRGLSRWDGPSLLKRWLAAYKAQK